MAFLLPELGSQIEAIWQIGYPKVAANRLLFFFFFFFIFGKRRKRVPPMDQKAEPETDRERPAETRPRRAENPKPGLTPLGNLQKFDQMQNLGNLITQTATAKGWTLSELSRQTGIGIGQISRIVNGKANPTVRTLEKIAAALEVDLIVSHASAV